MAGRLKGKVAVVTAAGQGYDSGPVTVEVAGGNPNATATATVSAADVVTGFTGVCLALERFRVPRVFCVQLMLLYRYIFVLSGEASRMARAREMRSQAETAESRDRPTTRAR